MEWIKLKSPSIVQFVYTDVMENIQSYDTLPDYTHCMYVFTHYTKIYTYSPIQLIKYLYASMRFQGILFIVKVK